MKVGKYNMYGFDSQKDYCEKLFDMIGNETIRKVVFQGYKKYDYEYIRSFTKNLDKCDKGLANEFLINNPWVIVKINN